MATNDKTSGTAKTSSTRPAANPDLFGAAATLATKASDFKYFRLNKLSEAGIGDLSKLPFSIKVLLESCLRNADNFEVNDDDVTGLVAWKAEKPKAVELPFKPA